MDLSPVTSFLAWASSGLLPERNLAASCSMLLSRVTSTVSVAFAPKLGGSLISCAARGARASNRRLAARRKKRGQTKLSLTASLRSARYSPEQWTVPSVPGFWHRLLAPRGIDNMNLLLYVMQFAAGNLQRQHDLRLGLRPFGAEAPLVLELHACRQQHGGRDRRRPPGTPATAVLDACQHAIGKSGWRLLPLQDNLQFVVQPAHRLTIPIVRATFS